MDDLDYLAGLIVSAAINIHRQLGPHLLESVYVKCMAHDLRKAGVEVSVEHAVRIAYDGEEVGTAYFLDLLVGRRVVVEVKSVKALAPEHTAQTLTYMRLGGFELGFLINFGQSRLIDGLKRFRM